MYGAMRTAVVTLFVLVPQASAFNPPTGKAGPITVHIKGPARVTRIDAPVMVNVQIENSSETRVQGHLRLGVIDHWKADPADPVPFLVEGKESTRLDFTVMAGRETFDALYPIHAFAQFDFNSRPYKAHAVLLLETALPESLLPQRSVDWKPLEVTPDTHLALWRVPVRRVVLQVFGEEPQLKPIGFAGSDPRTRASVSFGGVVYRGESRETIGMHPPWCRGQVGTAFVEYPLRLPANQPVRLTFANTIRDHNIERNEPPSDGVTFRVRVIGFDGPAGRAGTILFEKHTDAKVWQDGQVDLSSFAGQTIRLQLESHPGPKNDTTCDQSYWAEPTLIVGRPKAMPPVRSRRQELGKLVHDGQVYQVRITPGRAGLLDATVSFVSEERVLQFQGFAVRVLGEQLEAGPALSKLVDVETERDDSRYRVRHRFKGHDYAFDLLGELWIENHALLRATFRLENAPPAEPWRVTYLEDVAAGPWNRSAKRVYAGHGNVIERPEAFRLSFDGHRLATSFVGFDFADGLSLIQAVDVPPSHLEVDPEDKAYTLHTPHTQTLAFIPASNVWDGVKVWRDHNGLKPGGGVKRLAGRFVFDLWGGRYAASAQALRRAFRYGLTDAAVVWHNWQRWGYDYRLPDICPPNPQLGSLAEFRALVGVCKEHDVLFAPHDNYIDFYPDAAGYSYKHIAFHGNGQPVRAWLNKGRKAQSYRWRADHVEPFLRRNLKLIREGFAPTAFFIDVWSSICPYDYWTHDGRFFDRVYTRDTWAGHFACIREYLGANAPQISESGHDQLISFLDGAQTNHLRVDPSPPPERPWTVWQIGCADAERVPFFDAAHHDRFVLHGAGYEARYIGGLDRRLHGIYSDDYITTEVLTGHPAMVPAPFNRDVVRKYYLTHDVARAVALRRIDSVKFVGGDLHRQLVRWDNDGQIWVNRGQKDWTVAGHTLPEFGFYARIPTEAGLVEAAIERRQNVVVDWARSPAGVYVNARPIVDGPLPVRVGLDSIRYLEDRTFELVLRWEAGKPLPAPLTVFVHFVDQRGEIQLRADHVPSPPTDQWKGTVRTSAKGVIPEQASADQEFDLRVGLYERGGARVRLRGRDDGTRRIHLGSVRLDGNATDITGLTWTPTEQERDPVLARLNPDATPITFGAITTNGACRLTLRGNRLLLIPLPEGPRFAANIRWHRLDWKLPVPKHVELLKEDGSIIRREAVSRQGSEIVLTCEPGVFAYRFSTN